MPNEKTIKRILEDFEKRISVLEEIVIGRPKRRKGKASKLSLADHVLALRDKGFFSQPKTAEETHNKLKGKYHCELNRVAVVLVRLAGRKQLRKSSKTIGGKKYKAYVW